MLQYLLQQWIRQTAQQQLMQAVAKATSGDAAGNDTDGDEDAAPAAPPPPPPPCQVALLFALPIEAAGVIDRSPDLEMTRNATFVEHLGAWERRRICVAEIGAGAQKAAQAAADVIAVHRPAWVVSAGFAGGLVDELPRGHLLMASTVCFEGGEELSVGLQLDEETLARSPKLHVGRLVTVDRLIRTEREKRGLAERTGAVACDMETAAVAAVCRREKTRFLSVRVISDGVTDALPPEIERLVQSKTFARQLGAAAGAILKRPSAIKDLWQLREDAITFSDRLAKFLAGVVRQLD